MKKIKTILANDVQVGMKIKLTHSSEQRYKYFNARYFYVDDIDKEFISEEVSDLYDDDVLEEDIKPEHTKLTFYNEPDNDESICVIGTEILILK